MKQKQGIINKPFDIAAGFLLAILALLMLFVVHNITNLVNPGSVIDDLNNRENLLRYLYHIEEGHNNTVAERIIHYPATEEELEAITKTYFEPHYKNDWTIIITYPESYQAKDLAIGWQGVRRQAGIAFLPLPEGGHATIRLFLKHIPTTANPYFSGTYQTR